MSPRWKQDDRRVTAKTTKIQFKLVTGKVEYNYFRSQYPQNAQELTVSDTPRRTQL